MRVSKQVLVCVGGPCHGKRVAISGGVGTRVEVSDDRGNFEWYVMLSDGIGEIRLAHDAVQKAMSDELCAPEEVCALCGSAAERRRVLGRSLFDIDCDRCGRYRIATGVAQTILFQPREELEGFNSAIHDANERDMRFSVPDGAESPLVERAEPVE